MARSRPKTRRQPRSNPRGVLRVSAAGYGFVNSAEGEFFVPPTKMGGAFDGDLVELTPVSVNKQHKQPEKKYTQTGDKPTARVIRIIDRAHENLIGRYEVAEPFGVIVPHDHRIPYDIFTMRADNPHIIDGDIVRVRITDYPTRNTAAMGVIEEVIGHEGTENLPIEMIIARHDLETEFSEASQAQAKATETQIESALTDGYRDIRARCVFTIDPEDARDFDDAISLDEVEGLWRLGVHIADVSRYVEWGSAIDLEARRRATSVYLVDRVIPMIPEELSNDICSLKPHEARTTMSIDLYLDESSQLVRYDIYPAIIESAARFSYGEVQEVLEGHKESSFGSRLFRMHKIAQDLSCQREKAGGMDFVSTEAKVRLDDEGAPLEIVLRKKTDATEMIEEAMILANTTVAHHLQDRSFPSIYRVHEAPSPDALADLVPLLQEFDYFKELKQADFISGDPKTLQKVLLLSKGTAEEELISGLLLRAMKRARYEAVCEPHYGLAREEYTHFTSPIRRYPDLMVHRMLRAQMKKKPETFEEQVNSLPGIAEHASKMERIAEAAARESQEYKIIELLERDIGKTFEGLITGVTSYGFFVRLENTAEGLVSLKQLGNEYFAFDQQRHMLIGEESGICYRLGERVEVVLENADPLLGRLDFRVHWGQSPLHISP